MKKKPPPQLEDAWHEAERLFGFKTTPPITPHHAAQGEWPEGDDLPTDIHEAAQMSFETYYAPSNKLWEKPAFGYKEGFKRGYRTAKAKFSAPPTPSDAIEFAQWIGEKGMVYQDSETKQWYKYPVALIAESTAELYQLFKNREK